MKKLQILVIFILVVAVAAVYSHLHQIEKDTDLAVGMGRGTFQAGNSSSDATSAQSSADRGREEKSRGEFEALVQREVESISQLNNHPEEVQKRLRDLAEKMQESDVEMLQKSALNTSLNGDERFLSVYILGESSLTKAQESLEAIASSPVPALKEARLTTQEEILRVQAVESLRETSRIQRVLSEVDNSFISDRAQRNLLYREGKISLSPEQQDEEALNQLLKKTAR